jgi:hypothetical protein
MRTSGRKRITPSGTPRIATLVTPFVPSLSIAATTTISATPSGCPRSSRATPGAARMSGTLDSSMTLPSSASLPMRRTIALSALPDVPRVFLIPAESMSDDARTKTTSPIPTAVAVVVALRTARLRML